MKLTIAVASLALALSAAACKKDKKDDGGGTTTPAAEGTPKTTEPPKAAAKGRKIPNSDGLVVDAPAKWLDNGIGGAAGMHLDADAGMFMVREVDAGEAAKKMADWKKETEEMLFQKWISADEAPDGWKAVYAIDKITMKGDEPVKDGTAFAFHVRRKIGDKVHDCTGSAATEDTAKEATDLCAKISK